MIKWILKKQTTFVTYPCTPNYANQLFWRLNFHIHQCSQPEMNVFMESFPCCLSWHYYSCLNFSHLNTSISKVKSVSGKIELVLYSESHDRNEAIKVGMYPWEPEEGLMWGTGGHIVWNCEKTWRSEVLFSVLTQLCALNSGGCLTQTDIAAFSQKDENRKWNAYSFLLC